MTEPKRRRGPWPEPLDPQAPVKAPPMHSHRQPRAPWIASWTAIVGLIVAVALLTVYVVRFNDYVQGRGHLRDQENARLRQDIRDGICDLLDQLPASAVLDGPRQKYGCGPGIPIDQLPPSVRQHYTGVAPTTAPATTPATTPAAPTSSAPQQARQTGITAGAGTPPTSRGVPPPTRAGVTLPPKPVDPLLCKLTNICEVLP